MKEPTVDAARAAEILAATATEETEELDARGAEELPGPDEESEPDESESRPKT